MYMCVYTCSSMYIDVCTYIYMYIYIYMQIRIWGLVRSPSSSLAGPDAAAVRPGLPGLRLFSLSRLRFRLWGLGFFRVFGVFRV